MKSLYTTASLLVLVTLSLVAANAAAASQPLVGFRYRISGMPRCVQAGQRVRLTFVITNTVKQRETVKMRFPVVTGADMEIAFLAGTDRLSGATNNRYWQFVLAPGQSMTKHIEGLVKSPVDQKTSPAQWGLSLIISARNVTSVFKAVPVDTTYCAF